MSVTDLTGTTWIINSETTTPSSTIWKSINFTSNDASWNAIVIYDDMDNEQVIAYRNDEDFPTLVYEWGWSNEAYRTINISGGTDATDSTLIAWLENNAEQQIVTTPDISIFYNNAEIATMSDSGTKTLKTSGKYCTDDITVTYTKSGGGGTSQLYVFTQYSYGMTDVVMANQNVSPMTAYQNSLIVAGATVTFKSYNDYIIDYIEGLESGDTISYTTVTRGQYTFTMPNESVYVHLLYDD